MDRPGELTVMQLDLAELSFSRDLAGDFFVADDAAAIMVTSEAEEWHN